MTVYNSGVIIEKKNLEIRLLKKITAAIFWLIISLKKWSHFCTVIFFFTLFLFHLITTKKLNVKTFQITNSHFYNNKENGKFNNKFSSKKKKSIQTVL